MVTLGLRLKCMLPGSVVWTQSVSASPYLKRGEINLD